MCPYFYSTKQNKKLATTASNFYSKFDGYFLQWDFPAVKKSWIFGKFFVFFIDGWNLSANPHSEVVRMRIF